jgi:hypothetical protein
MISANLVQLVEDHSDGVATRIIRQLREDPRLPHMGSLPEGELRSRAREILKHLGHWLLVSKERESAKHFEEIGAERFREGIPLAELALAYIIVKAQIIQFVRDQGIGQTAVELYAEEELEHVVSRFFDMTVYNLIKGYENALNGAESFKVVHHF